MKRLIAALVLALVVGMGSQPAHAIGTTVPGGGVVVETAPAYSEEFGWGMWCFIQWPGGSITLTGPVYGFGFGD